MKYLCIHGHFYQPPRENPWLEAIELQDSAYPYHDWNARIAAECYAPNVAARIKNGRDQIIRIVNNYAHISFNFGPTLLSWAKINTPDLYQQIIVADGVSRQLYTGHGSALAQAYNHIIMPLANSRDKETQVIWGIEDFRFRFGRDPEGMWLPETAVDVETLNLLAKHGIKFTILAPYQAKRIRKTGASDWSDVTGGRIDPTQPYAFKTPGGHTISLFFYDGPISRAVAFERLLNNGEVFAQRLMTAYGDRPGAKLAHIATDGESYGHHHPHGEMALAYALHHIRENNLATITNYGEFLEKCPPTHDVEIYENTAWSCAHGVGRWSINCGCNSGGHGHWNQQWRGPLRDALNWLRDAVAPCFESKLKAYFEDPWAARNDYIKVVLDRAPDNRDEFLMRHGIREFTPAEEVEIWKLLELQRHAMLMYTSCGWFFDELSGIETVQVIEYAARVVQLAEELFARQYEPAFLEKLARAQSNVADYGDGAQIYLKLVKPNIVGLREVAAHYAISSLFRQYEDESHIYCYRAERIEWKTSEAGRLRLGIGRARFTSEITQESGEMFFGVLHFGDHTLTSGVRAFTDAVVYEQFVQRATSAFSRADAPEVFRILERTFGEHTYSLKSLFRDEQRSILDQILTSTIDDAESVYRQLYEHHAPLMRFLTDLKTPLPRALEAAAHYALNSLLRHALADDALDAPRILNLLNEAQENRVDLDTTTLEFTFRNTLERLADRVRDQPEDTESVDRLKTAVKLLRSLPFQVNLWNVQNIAYDLLKSYFAEATTDNFKEIDAFRALATELAVTPA